MQVLGTPNEDNWPGIGRTEELQSYKFPHYTAEPLVARAPRLDPDGISLLNSFLHFEARRRISAREAMKNPYFQSLGSGVAQLGDSEFLCLFSINFPPIILFSSLDLPPLFYPRA